MQQTNNCIIESLFTHLVRVVFTLGYYLHNPSKARPARNILF